jgi:Transposase
LLHSCCVPGLIRKEGLTISLVRGKLWFVIRTGVVEAVNGNIKALLRRGRGYRDLDYLLLKAQRLAATKTEFVAFQKAA